MWLDATDPIYKIQVTIITCHFSLISNNACWEQNLILGTTRSGSAAGSGQGSYSNL